MKEDPVQRLTVNPEIVFTGYVLRGYKGSAARSHSPQPSYHLAQPTIDMAYLVTGRKGEFLAIGRHRD
jgi:hypothetical protein